MRWKKLSDFSFAFYTDDTELGTMNINYSSKNHAAECKIGDQVFQLRRTGFWKSGLEIENTSTGEIVLTAAPKKWYSNKLDVWFNQQQHELKIWNNPLAEWSLEKDGKTVLAYGLNSGGQTPGVRITAADSAIDPLLHFFLWYLFFPVAQENAGDNLLFHVLLAQ